MSAINLVAEGELSDEVSATPSANAAGDRAPDAPTGLQATAGDGRVDLSWNAPDNTGTAGGTKVEITHYLVYKSTSSGNLETGDTKRVESGTSATFDGLANGTTFYFAVSAVNSVGEGALSNEVSAMPTANAPGDRAPDAPTESTGSGG